MTSGRSRYARTWSNQYADALAMTTTPSVITVTSRALAAREGGASMGENPSSGKLPSNCPNGLLGLGVAASSSPTSARASGGGLKMKSSPSGAGARRGIVAVCGWYCGDYTRSEEARREKERKNLLDANHSTSTATSRAHVRTARPRCVAERSTQRVVRCSFISMNNTSSRSFETVTIICHRRSTPLDPT